MSRVCQRRLRLPPSAFGIIRFRLAENQLNIYRTAEEGHVVFHDIPIFREKRIKLPIILHYCFGE